jgi:hypothetical protein
MEDPKVLRNSGSPVTKGLFLDRAIKSHRFAMIQPPCGIELDQTGLRLCSTIILGPPIGGNQDPRVASLIDTLIYFLDVQDVRHGRMSFATAINLVGRKCLSAESPSENAFFTDGNSTTSTRRRPVPLSLVGCRCITVGPIYFYRNLAQPPRPRQLFLTDGPRDTVRSTKNILAACVIAIGYHA